MKRRHPIATVHSAQLALALCLLAGLPLTASQAFIAPLALDGLRQEHREFVADTIAEQGNAALQAIRADSRRAIGNWAPPALPPPAQEAQTVAAR